MRILKHVFTIIIFITIIPGCSHTNSGTASQATTPENVSENKVQPSTEEQYAPESSSGGLLVKDNNYRIGAGDRLFISVWGHPNLGTPASLADKGGTSVEENGVIFLPVAGEIKVSEMTIGELRTAVTEAYSKYVKNPQINVSIMSYGSKFFYILGEVRNSGSYEIKRPISLLQALSVSGGLTAAADLKKAYVIRGNKILPVDFEKMINAGDTSMNIEIATNDFIFIPKRDEKIVYVLGEVKTPGAVKMANDKMNLISAVASSGDFTIFAVKNNIKILRGELRNPTVITANLSQLKNRDEISVNNIELESGDIVYVPDSTIGKIDKILERIAPVLRTINEGLQPFYMYRLIQDINR